MNVLGVDPGGKGALALYASAPKTLAVWDMPTNEVTVGKSKRTRLDLGGLGELLDMLQAVWGLDRVVIEQVGGMPGQSSGFAFGFSVGALHMALRDRMIVFDTVTPGQWKKALKVPKEKKEAVARADELFPNDRKQFRNNEPGARGGLRPDRAEAALIALWGATCK